MPERHPPRDPSTPEVAWPGAPLPPEVAALDHHVRARYRRARRLAHLMDSQFPLPGTERRFGVDAVLGFIPGIGGAAGLVLAGYIIAEGIAIGARGATVVRMVLNAGIDATLSAVPLVGGISDIFFKANSRNVALLSTHALDPERTRQQSRRVVIVTVAVIVVAFLLVIALAVALLVWLVTLIF